MLREYSWTHWVITTPILIPSFSICWQTASLRNEETLKRSDSEANGFVLKTQRQLTNGCHHGGGMNGGKNSRINYGDEFCSIYMSLYLIDDLETLGVWEGGEMKRDSRRQSKDVERKQFKKWAKNRSINQLSIRSFSYRLSPFCPFWRRLIPLRPLHYHPSSPPICPSPPTQLFFPLLSFSFSINILQRKSHQAV